MKLGEFRALLAKVPDDAEINFADGNFSYRVAHKEKKLVPHWPAIYLGIYESSILSASLFPNEEAARKEWSSIIRLATEYPPIMLEVKE